MSEFRGAVDEPDSAHAGGHRARTDEHHLSARATDQVDLPPERVDPVRIEQAVGASEHQRPNLDNDQAGGGGDLLAERVAHGPESGVVRGWDGWGNPVWYPVAGCVDTLNPAAVFAGFFGRLRP